MLKGRRIQILFAGLILCLGLSCMFYLDAEAASKKEYLDSLSVGITQIIDPTTGSTNEQAIQELTEMASTDSPQTAEESDLVMVNVQMAMNVRSEASEDSDKVGVLYKD